MEEKRPVRRFEATPNLFLVSNGVLVERVRACLGRKATREIAVELEALSCGFREEIRQSRRAVTDEEREALRLLGNLRTQCDSWLATWEWGEDLPPKPVFRAP